MDPLTGAVCNPPEIWQMIDEMLIAEAEWLPQYTQAIAEAKERFAKGDLIPTKDGYQGAVRIREKTVEEISAERESRTNYGGVNNQNLRQGAEPSVMRAAPARFSGLQLTSCFVTVKNK